MDTLRTPFRCVNILAASAMLTALTISPSLGADVVTEWATVKTPAAPELKSATLDGKTTALLILDLQVPGCTRRPRCVATVPNVKKLMDAARAAHAMVFYTFTENSPDIANPGLAPLPGEWIAQQGPDKFFGSNLEERLKARGIKTVIVTGTSAQGAIIGTAVGATQRGFKVVLPVDCMSSEDIYMEQYVAWHLYKGGPVTVTTQTTLTRSDMIKF